MEKRTTPTAAFFSSDNIHATVLFRSPVRYKMDHIAACNYYNVHNLLASSSTRQEQYFLSLLVFQEDMYTMNLVSVQQWTRQIERERALVPSFQSNFQNTWLFILFLDNSWFLLSDVDLSKCDPLILCWTWCLALLLFQFCLRSVWFFTITVLVIVRNVNHFADFAILN